MSRITYYVLCIADYPSRFTYHASRITFHASRFTLHTPFLTFLITLLVYLSTLSPDLTWQHWGVDGGELITAAVTLGVPHSPGYPTYVLLGKLVSYLPIGTVAYRFNLFSAVCMALAAALVTSVFRIPYSVSASHDTQYAIRNMLSSLSLGLTFAFMPLIWSQAIITEVYALNLLLLAALLWLLGTGKPTWLAGLLFGLSITTHLTSLLMLPLVLVLLSRSHVERIGNSLYSLRQQYLFFTIGTLAGLLPWLAIPWLAHSGSPIRWGRPDTLTGWWWLVSGRLYASNVFNLGAAEVLTRLRDWLPTLAAQFGWVGLLLLPMPAKAVTTNSETAEAVTTNLRVSLVGSNGFSRLFIFLTAAAYFVYALTYSSADAIIFCLPGLLLLSILLKNGLERLGPAGLVLPLLLVALNYGSLNEAPAVDVRQLAETHMQPLPPSAIVLTPGDETIFTLWYFQHVEGQRPDLVLVDGNLFAFDWYRHHLNQRYPWLTHLEHDDLEGFQQQNRRQRPFCFVSLSAPDQNRCLPPVTSGAAPS